MSDPPSDKPAGEGFDVALIGDATDDGGGRKVLRLRPDGVAVGEVRPLREGQPIQGEVVQLKPREGAPWVCDVDVAVPAPQLAPSTAASTPAPRVEAPPAERRSGPAQVATAAYRDSWERIFGEAGAPGRRKGDLN